MKTLDLKLGNFFHTTHHAGIRMPVLIAMSITKIELFKVHLKMGDICDPQNDSIEFEAPTKELIGIDLTELWLKKFGFKQDLLTSRKFNFPKSNWSIANMYEDGWLFGNSNWETSIKIKYVHELQNLYSAVAQEQLAFPFNAS